MKLYEISEQLAIVNDELEASGGELTEELEKRLDASTLALNEKVEGIGKWCLGLDAKEDVLDREIERLKMRKKITSNLKERLKNYVMDNLIRAGIKKLEYDTFNISVANNPPSVDIINDLLIPAKFKTIIPESYVTDKKRVIEALKAGEKVEGAILITDKRHLRIK